ncbi:MAG: GyrI-like domain-containing protein [Anaerolineae bacterium]|nr:GyrI-like domain-containing protein [Anaerolineae bacterium]
MKDLEVRIVDLAPMRVACAHGFGESPEGVAEEKMQVFISQKGLTDTQHFGFNNPNPSPGSPNYGYDIWVTVGTDVEGTDEIEIKTFEGGLYAVTRFEGLQNIGAVWQGLVNWRDESLYKEAHHQWLEALLTSPDVATEEYVFDLYLPIAK